MTIKLERYASTHKFTCLNKSNPSRKLFYFDQDQNLVPVIHLVVIAKHFPPNPNLQVKTRNKIPYLSQFAIIAKRQGILLLNA